MTEQELQKHLIYLIGVISRMICKGMYYKEGIYPARSTEFGTFRNDV